MDAKNFGRTFTTTTAALCALTLAMPAGAVDIWTIGTADNADTEFLVLPTAGAAIDGPYLFDVDVDIAPDDFVRLLAGMDEDPAGDVQPGDFSPLTIAYTTDCDLLPGSEAELAIDVASLHNVVDDPLGNDGELAWSVDIGGAVTAISFAAIDTPGGAMSPGALGVGEVHTFAVTQDQLGADIIVSMDDGWRLSFDALALTGDCVDDSAKISGKIGTGNGKGRGRGAPTHTFAGAVGTDTDGGTVGEITVNYRPAGETPSTCTYTPVGALVYNIVDDLDVAMIDTDYECIGGIYHDYAGAASILLTARDKGNDRGTVVIVADHGLLDIEDSLETGNVIIAPPVI